MVPILLISPPSAQASLINQPFQLLVFRPLTLKAKHQ